MCTLFAQSALLRGSIVRLRLDYYPDTTASKKAIHNVRPLGFFRCKMTQTHN